MWSNLQSLLNLAVLVTMAYVIADVSHEQVETANRGPTGEEALRVQRFLSFAPEAQGKALAYLQNLQRYLKEGE